MNAQPLRTSVIGSYPFPGWLEFAAGRLDAFGRDDLEELQEDAAMVAIQDQLAAGLDVITDGEQTRLDFNLSFYGFLQGISLEPASPRRFGPPASSPPMISAVVMKSSVNWRRRAAWVRSPNSSDCAVWPVAAVAGSR